MISDERYVLLLKNCVNVNNTPVLRICGLIYSNELEFVNICTQYALHYNLKKTSIKDAIY